MGGFLLTSIDPVVVSATVFEIFDVYFNDLKLGGFKVIQGQR